MKQLIRAGMKRMPDEELRQIRVPTALIWGAHDRMVPHALAVRAHERFGWPLQLVPDAAHVPHIEQPELFPNVIAGVNDMKIRTGVAAATDNPDGADAETLAT